MSRPLLMMERPGEGQPPDDMLRDALRATWDEGWGRLDELAIRVFSPSFYEDVLLVEIELGESLPPNARAYCLIHQGSFLWLRGTSPPIHETNGKSRPWLRENTVLEYLAFFNFFVRGDEGPFLVVDARDSRYLPDVPDCEAWHAVFRAPRVWGQDENGDWRITATIYYSNAVFLADFLVHLGGTVEMQRDNLLLADLPNRINAPLEARRRDS